MSEKQKSYYQPYYTPLGNRVLINPVVGDGKTHSGIKIPEAAMPPIQKALVVKVGPGVDDKRPCVKAGDTIIMSRGVGVEVEFGDAKYRIIKDSDVLAIV